MQTLPYLPALARVHTSMSVQARNRLAQHLYACINLCLCDHKGGYQPNHITAACCDGQHAHVTRRIDDRACRDIQLHATQQAHAAHILDVRALDLLQACKRKQAHARHVLGEVGCGP